MNTLFPRYISPCSQTIDLRPGQALLNTSTSSVTVAPVVEEYWGEY